MAEGSRTRARAKLAPNDDIGEATRLALWRSQFLIREAEKRAYDLFLQNLVKGTSHLSLGQEAIAAGFATAQKKDDWTFATYRGHAHTLARGAPLEGVLGELMGRDCGLMHGKGGSMHLTSAANNMMGSYAIVGALVMLPVIPFVWTMPQNWKIAALMVGIGALGSIGHFFMISAHKLAPASVLSPYIYTQLIWVGILGYLVFDHVPNELTMVGAAIVICSGLYLLYREQQVGKTTTSEAVIE